MKHLSANGKLKEHTARRVEGLFLEQCRSKGLSFGYVEMEFV